MNPDRDFDRLLDQWFADGPMEVADRVVVQVADRIERQSQRPAWRIQWKDAQMTSPARVAAALAAVLVLAIGAYTFMRQPAPGSVGTGSTPSPAAAATSAAFFSSATFEVPLSLTLVDGWSASGESPGNIDLINTGSNLDGGIMSIASLQVFSAPGGPLEPWPADFQTWLAAQPEFKAGPPKDVTVGGRPAVQIDVDVSLSQTDATRGVLRIGSNGFNTVRSPERWRFIVITTEPGAGLVILLPAPPDKATAAFASLDGLLATMQFDAPATYTTTAGPQGTTVLHAANFDVPLSLTFGADRHIAAVDKGVVDLLLQDGSDLGIHSMALVTLPGATLTDPWIPVPADFVAWIDQRPEFVPSAPRTVTIAGRSGTLIDADFVWKDGTAKRDFLRYGTGAWLYDQYDAGGRVRFVILPGPSGVGGIVIVMNASGAGFEAAATSLDALLATIQFDAPAASPSN